MRLRSQDIYGRFEVGSGWYFGDRIDGVLFKEA